MTDHDKYYAAAQGWADERVEAERKARKLAWTVAGVAATIALILALTLAMLVPLKTVQPYVVTVDRQSGAVEVATTVANGRLTQNEAVIQAQLANYVRVRETFDASDLAENYRRVQLLSSSDVRTAYIALMAAANPASPLRALSPGDTLKVRIKSVSLTGTGSALVRYDIDRTVAAGRGVSSTAYVSAISYGFSNKPLRAADRFENPLGFEVTRYRRDVEGMTQ
ncbi:VirB8/TrbF family protein [Sphingomonas sp.]|uniref:virB8 family protein n=1 Tax=Sphingomonas sp. TaxID=28214 RepID=UPI00286B0065|nr:VirB8/TrbF family protein [Sphingomonas sp.]